MRVGLQFLTTRPRPALYMWPFYPLTVCYVASGCGRVTQLDIETGQATVLMNLNPAGWVGDVKSWRMLYGLDVCGQKDCAYVGDDLGRMHIVDARLRRRGGSGGAGRGGTGGDGAASTSSASTWAGTYQLATKGTKVQSIHVHPLDSNLILTGGNDRFARLFDVRMLRPDADAAAAIVARWPAPGLAAAASPHKSKGTIAPLASFAHGGVINAVQFSPLGTKFMTTCQDNRLRIWDNIHGPMSREVGNMGAGWPS